MLLLFVLEAVVYDERWLVHVHVRLLRLVVLELAGLRRQLGLRALGRVPRLALLELALVVAQLLVLIEQALLQLVVGLRVALRILADSSQHLGLVSRRGALVLRERVLVVHELGSARARLQMRNKLAVENPWVLRRGVGLLRELVVEAG